MKRLLAVLLLLIIGESAYAEYITILPVNSQTVANASSEIITLSELYGKSTTVRYMTDSTTPEFIALNNTNIYPMNTLTLTEDVLLDNKMFGFYVGASRQTKEAIARQVVDTAMEMIPFTSSELEYQSLVTNTGNTETNNLSDSENNAISGNSGSEIDNLLNTNTNSNIELATILEGQNNDTSDSDLLSLDTDLESENSLLADDKTTSLIDTILPGSSQSNGNDLPMSNDNIIISGLGGSILSGGGSGTGGTGNGVVNAGGASVPEPSTWLLLVLGVTGLTVYRKRIAR